MGLHVKWWAALLLVAGCSRGYPVDVVHVDGSRGIDDLPALAPAPEDWPWWRGPTRDGHAASGQAPLEWSEKQGVVWRTRVPGRGHGSPVVWGDQVFVPTADEQAETISLVCFDRESGAVIWTSEMHRGRFVHRHETNSHASATPACDGQRVFMSCVIDDGLWVTAVGCDGKIRWQQKAGGFVSQHGFGSSPVLYKSLVIVSGDNNGPGYLAALHRQTGDVVWRVERTNAPSYGTPVVATVAGKPQLLLGGCEATWSYNPDNGDLLWKCAGPADVAANTMAFGGDRVFASGGYPQKELICVRADGTGDVSTENILWQSREGVAYVPSPLLVRDRLFLVNDNGVATCYGADSGHVFWQQRLRGKFSASPVMAEGRIYATNEDGVTYVFAAKDQWDLLARNTLPEGAHATPAICGNRIFLRTEHELWCLGEK